MKYFHAHTIHFLVACVAFSTRSICSTTITAQTIKNELQKTITKLFEPAEPTFLSYLISLPSELREYIQSNQLLLIAKNQSDQYTVERYFYYYLGKTIYSSDEYEKLLAEIRYYAKQYVAPIILHQWYYEYAQRRLKEQKASFDIEIASRAFADFYFARAYEHFAANPSNTLFSFRDVNSRFESAFPR